MIFFSTAVKKDLNNDEPPDAITQIFIRSLR